MSPRPFRRSRFALLLACLAALGCLRAVAPSTPPPAPVGVQGGMADGGFFFVQWKEGLAVLVVDDIAGGGNRSYGGHSSSSNPFHTSTGSVTSNDGRRYAWELKSRDGQTADFRLEGVGYDLAQGTVLVVRTKGGKAKVVQLTRDLSGLSPDTASCQAFIEKDAEMMKLLKGEAGPQ